MKQKNIPDADLIKIGEVIRNARHLRGDKEDNLAKATGFSQPK